jgi:hypothetical protein
LLLEAADWLAALWSAALLELLLCGVVALEALWSDGGAALELALLCGCEYEGDAAELVDALSLGAAAADVVSVLLLGAVVLAGGCEAMLVLEVWSVLDVVLVAGVWLLTAGLVLAGACEDSVEDAGLAAFSPSAL